LFHGVIRTSHAVRAIDRADTPARRAELARALANWATWFRPGREAVATGRRDDPAQAAQVALRAAAAGARCYVARPTIVDLHGVTGAMAVELLTHHIPSADAGHAVSQLAAEHQDLYRGVVPVADRDGDRHPTGWDDDLAEAAAESGDAHQVKLVEACRRGFEVTGDAGFFEASRTVTGLDRR
jgi:hypothetical protein